MKLQKLSLTILLSMICVFAFMLGFISIGATTAYAEQNEGGAEEETMTQATYGDFLVQTNGGSVKATEYNITLSPGYEYHIYMAIAGTSDMNIVIADDNTATDTIVTLHGVRIESSSSCIVIETNSADDAVYLLLDGENTLKGFGGPAISKVYWVDSKTGHEDGAGLLHIGGTGSLTATSTEIGSAGIGGSWSGTKNITIASGTITATGGSDTEHSGAGIGGGSGGSAENITITGGTVTATGGAGNAVDGSSGAAGIGGGYNGDCSGVTITGGTVTSTGGHGGAGIGGGYNGDCTGVTITGGMIIATGKNDGAGIGGGETSNIIIDGGSIKANGDRRIGATPKNSKGKNVYLVTATLLKTLLDMDEDYVIPPAANAYVYKIEEDPDYGMKNVVTDSNGKIFIYLPENTVIKTITAYPHVHEYMGDVTEFTVQAGDDNVAEFLADFGHTIETEVMGEQNAMLFVYSGGSPWAVSTWKTEGTAKSEYKVMLDADKTTGEYQVSENSVSYAVEKLNTKLSIKGLYILTKDENGEWKRLNSDDTLSELDLTTLEIDSRFAQGNVEWGSGFTMGGPNFTFTMPNFPIKILAVVATEEGNIPPTITKTALPNAVAGEAYSEQVEISGHFDTFYLYGDLPAGLTFDTATGTISGTTTALGTYTFEVAVVGVGYGGDSKTITLTVNAPQVHPHNQMDFATEWTAVSGAVDSGNYYLTQDVTATGTITVCGTVNLCLNGYTLDLGNASLLSVSDGAIFNIYDCSADGTGTVTSANTFQEGTLFNEGTLVLHGGNIVNTASSGTAIRSLGTLSILSGTVNGSKYAIFNNGGTVNISGGIVKSYEDDAIVITGENGAVYLSGNPTISTEGEKKAGIYRANMVATDGFLYAHAAGDTSNKFIGTIDVSLYSLAEGTVAVSGATQDQKDCFHIVNEGGYKLLYNANGGTLVVHKHDMDSWKVDENEHWHECTCGENTAKEPHDLSGSSCTACGIHIHDGIVFDKALSAGATNMVLESGNYYLPSNVNLSSCMNTAIGGDVKLCLGNHTLNFGYTGTLTVPEGKTLEIYACGTSGTLTGANTGDKKVIVNNGTLKIHGGIIYETSNAIAIENNGILEISGGKFLSLNQDVIKNTSAGVVYLSKNAVITSNNANKAGIYRENKNDPASCKVYAHANGDESDIFTGTASISLYTLDEGTVAVYGVTDDHLNKFTLINQHGYLLIQADANLLTHKHDFSGEYLSDENGHWHKCANCAVTDEKQNHTPNISAATEQQAKVCTECDYELEAQLPHTHSYTLEVAEEQYKVSDATCTEKAVYYKSCSCELAGNDTFEYGAIDETAHTGTATKLVDHQNGTHDLVYTCCDAVANDNVTCIAALVDNDCSTAEVCTCGYVMKSAASHDFSGAYLKDENGHWHKCKNCAVTDTKESHTPNISAATEQQAKVCTECDYELEAQLGHTHSYTLEVAMEQYKVSDATCTAKAVYYKSCACGRAGTDTFEYGEKDMSNHAKDTFTYENNGNGTHTKKNECCKTVVTADETHTFDANDDCICGAEKPIPTYTVTVENGTASDGNTSVVVNENGSVTVTANAAPEGKQFKGWSVNGTVVSTEQSYTFNATADTTITAVYEDIATNPPVDTPKENPDGLSGGAIAGIVIACVLALAGGGFALYWFVIRKKKAN